MKLSKKLFMLGMIGCLSAGFSVVSYADAASNRAQMYQDIIDREEANIKKYEEELPGLKEELAELEAELEEMDAYRNQLIDDGMYDDPSTNFDEEAYQELQKSIRTTKNSIRNHESGIIRANRNIAEAKENISDQLDVTFINGYSREDDDTFVNAAGDEISNLTQRVALGYVDGEWRVVIPYRAWNKYGPAGGNWDYTGYAGITSNMEITLDGQELEHDSSLDTDYAYVWRVDFDITPNTVYDMTINGRSYSVKSEFADYDGDGIKDLNGYNPALDNPYSYENTYGKYNSASEPVDTTDDTETTNTSNTGTTNTNTENTTTTNPTPVVNNGLATYLVLTGSDYIASVEDNTGSWELQSDGKWKYKKSNGTYATNEYVKVNGVWYAFGWGSIMESDCWLRFDYPTGVTYFCQSNGAMPTGWCQIGGNWYYFNADNSLFKNGTTPDGYTVDDTGKWIQ